MAAIEKGYDKTFLGKSLKLPTVNQRLCAPLRDGSGFELQYTHFSIYLHQDRRLPYICAVNIKGEAYNAPTRKGNEPWNYSDQVAEEYQIDNDFYSHDENTFDRGHIVRRVDPCWGALSDQAEQDTFHWVNCTPQHKKLNQKGGIWFQLEQHIIEHGVKNKLADVSVFAGPVLDSTDLPFRKSYHDSFVKVPVVFWKIIVWKKTDGKLYAVGFMMSQWEFIKDKLIQLVKLTEKVKASLPDDYFENLKFEDHKTYQVAVSSIEKATGIKFNWSNVSFPFSAKPKVVRGTPLKEVRSFKEIFALKSKALDGSVTLSEQALKKGVNKLPSLSPQFVAAAVSGGESYLLKRYQLSNITL